MDTRDRLIGAAQELLWERGYAATSPKDIQAAAQAGQGSMYHHFRGKQDLAAAALERSGEAFRSETLTVLAGPGSPMERITRYLTRQRDSLRGCRIGRMTYDADVVTDEMLLAPVAQSLQWLVDAIAGVLREGVSAGELAPGLDASVVAATLVAVVQGGYVLARAQRDPAPFDAAVAGALTLLEGVRA